MILPQSPGLLAEDAPLPCVGSVVVPVTKVGDIDQRESVIVDHVQLVVAVLPHSATPSQSHGLCF